MARSTRRRCRSNERRSQPLVEGLESRRLLAVTYSVYPISPTALPNSITVGPDRNLWFTLPSPTPQIGQVNPITGVVSVFPIPSAFFSPSSLVSGPGGDLWFVDLAQLDSFDPMTHVTTIFTSPAPGAVLRGLAVGPDGNLWFTDQTNAAVGVFSPTAHTFTEFPLPNSSFNPGAITAGPGGNLWFGLGGSSPTPGSAIGDINPTSHVITVTTLPTPQADPGAITTGADGNLWFNEIIPGVHATQNPQIASINPTTRVIHEYPGGGLGGITAGPDGEIWYSSAGPDGSSGIGEIDPTTHAVSTYAVPGGTSEFDSTLVTGPDGKIWVAVPKYINSASIIPATQSAVAGYVYLDPNGTGTTDDGPLANATVFLDLRADGQLDAGDPVTNTDVLGYYAFPGLAPGTYTVRVVPYPGNFATSPNNSTQTVTVTGGQLGSPAQLGLLPSTSLQPLSYNTAPFGTHNPDVQTAEVNGLYHLILHRAPDPTGGASAVSYLKNVGPVEQLANDLLNSPEYETDVVASYYQTYLRRTGSTAEIAAWVAVMQQPGGPTAKVVAATFLDSAEYNALFPANATFIQALYGDLLGRLPAVSEIAGGVNLLNGGVSRSQLVSAFIGTLESDIRGVEGFYGIIFARTVHSDERTEALWALQAGLTLVQLATGMFGSAEFTARANLTVG